MGLIRGVLLLVQGVIDYEPVFRSRRCFSAKLMRMLGAGFDGRSNLYKGEDSGVLFGVHEVEMPAVIERFQNLDLNSQIFHYFTSNS